MSRGALLPVSLSVDWIPLCSSWPYASGYYGDTTILDDTEQWFGRSMDEIIGFRSQLVRGMTPVNVRKPEKAGKILEATER